jgi:predicted DNA-binding transcriptional regulator YafY
VNRVDRLLALVAELRAAAPDPVDADALADRLGVSTRTLRRDLELLTHGGLPVRRERGRGYVLPPDPRPGPLTEPASLVGPVRDTLAEAVRTRRIVRLAYTDPSGARTYRDVEPHGLVVAPSAEYLVGWCRLRRGPRMFRLDRVGAAFLSGRGAGARDLDALLAALRVPLPRPPADPPTSGPANAARAWTLDRFDQVRVRLREVTGAARSAGADAGVREALGHLAAWTRWQSSAIRATATGTTPTYRGDRPDVPAIVETDLPYPARERRVQHTATSPTLADLAHDLSESLRATAHWAATCDPTLWQDTFPDPRPVGPPGPPRPLTDLLAGWRGPLSHIEWHLPHPPTRNAPPTTPCPLQP